MVLIGGPEYELHFYETDALTDAQRIYFDQQYALFSNWYADWSKQPGVVAQAL